MQLSFRWLGRHVDLSGVTPHELAENLSLSTCEVERVARFAPQLGDVTVGHVVERAKHPEADKLSVCRVDVGADELLQIVCGAPNVAAGQRVAVATVGTTLPGDFKIKKSKIRGQESNGMICSERELGLGDEHDGIWVLPGVPRIGAKVADALELADWSIEIDNKSITHRPDLWGHRGIARELAAIFERPLAPLDTSLPAPGRGAPFPVRIESDDCGRYLALSFENVRNGRSPSWLRMLLLAAGQRPIDFLVDLTNFVMLDLGQPNHAFDRERLGNDGIVVRKARAGERMSTLDGVERKLEPSDLLICDGEKPVALAGIMGGAESKVAATTRSLLLEVASFHPTVVRRTAARLGLRTDASARFEKNLSPTLTHDAAGRFARLLLAEQPDAVLAAPPADVGRAGDPSRRVAVRGDVVRKKLGVDLGDPAIGRILERLALSPQPTADGFEARVYPERATKDLTVEQDLVEEIGRIHRYGNVPERKLVAELEPPPPDARRVLLREIEDRLAGAARFRQTISYSFVADGLLAKLRLLDAPHVQVVNPIAEGLSRVRRSVAPSLLASLEHNRRHAKEVRLFEIGKGYLPEHANEHGEPREVHELAMLLACEPRRDARFDGDALHRLLGAIEDLFFALELDPPAFDRASGDLPTWAHPSKCLALRSAGGETAQVAALEPGLARELGLTGELESDVALASLPIELLLAAPRRASLYRPLPRYPGVKVDVALALPAEALARDVARTIADVGKGLVRSVELFDVYTGPNAGPGRKSLAFHVLLEAADRTLDQQDAQKFLARVERAAGELGGELRKA